MSFLALRGWGQFFLGRGCGPESLPNFTYEFTRFLFTLKGLIHQLKNILIIGNLKYSKIVSHFLSLTNIDLVF